MHFCITLLICLGGVAVLVSGRSEPKKIEEVTFYQHPVCNGHHYTMTLGEGCRNVPEWLTEAEWNLSIDPQGHCVKLYDGPDCQEFVPQGGAFAAPTPSREDVIRRCKSTKQLGFDTVLSFKRVPC